MSSRKWISHSSIAAGLCFVISVGTSQGATDPGPRSAGPIAGGLPGLTPAEQVAFKTAKALFEVPVSVDGSIPTEPDDGLGPTFNGNSCVSCHSFPSTGGSSPRTNPQIAVATLHGAHNIIPSFLSANGPVREVRFKRNPDGSPDGGVHALFVITGRSDCPPGFDLQQTDFAPAVSANNVSFRIPTPVFGAGLIEAIPDAAILANQAAYPHHRAALGISGKLNRSGNDGTITRFGWKAQNKSLLMFAGEAYNVEEGVTNDIFPNARELNGQVLNSNSPESGFDIATGSLGDIDQFTIFMRLLDAPPRGNPPGVDNESISDGERHFTELGCIQCHTSNLNTGPSTVAALSKKAVPLFSDLLLHKMGPGLADEVGQGAANGDQFRSAPLWGLGQRLFFLHDGRTNNLDTAIRAHASNGNGQFGASEANATIQNYINLDDAGKQDLLNFLRSL